MVFSALICATCLWIDPAQENAAADSATIRFNDRPTRRGVTVLSVDSAAVRIRMGDPEAYLVYLIPREEIQSIEQAGTVWRQSDLDRYPAASAKQLGAPFLTKLATADHSARTALPSETPRRVVRSIAARARLANWDRDPNHDGILVVIYPEDGSGEPLEVSGTLFVELLAQPDSFSFLENGNGYRGRVRAIGRWSVPVRSSRGAPIRARLPFQGVDPNRAVRWHPDQAVGPLATVSVRLAVPGHGVFRAFADAPVRIRPFDPVRDQLFRDTGKRTLPWE